MSREADLSFMARALDLARKGVGKTGENPSVGCVIVRDGAVIGEARTGKGGRPHAEEKALEGVDAMGATAFVTLEPCGERSNRTASCAELLADSGVARVVIAARDPHPFAKGRGIALLEEAGIKVEIGLMETEARTLNADFIRRWE